MTRVEYIRQLEFSLCGKLADKEVRDILRDYSEYFDAGRAEGKTEEEISVSLGIPSAAAAEILLEAEDGNEARSAEKLGWIKRIHHWLYPNGEEAQETEDENKNGNGGGESETVAWWKSLLKWPKGYVQDLISGESEQPPTETAAPSSPTYGYDRTAAPRETSTLGRWVLSTLLFLLFFPLMALVLFFGGILLACLSAVLVVAGCLLIIVFICSILGVFVCICALTLVGGLLPATAAASVTGFLVAWLAGGVFALCLGLWSLRTTARLARYCLKKRSILQSARNPEYRARQTQNIPAGDAAWAAADALAPAQAATDMPDDAIKEGEENA